MKKISLFFACILSSSLLSAQDDGSSTGGHKGLDFDINVGYNIATKKDTDGSISAEFSVGKRFSKSFSWGLGAGAYFTDDIQIPITTEAKAYLPVGKSKVSPFVSLKAGYVINTADDIHTTVGTGKYKQHVDISMPDFALLQIMPGVSFPLSPSIDFNFGAGYAHGFPLESGGNGSGMVVIRGGFSFHKPVASNHTPRGPVPTRDNGFTVALEGETVNPWNFGQNAFASGGGNIVLGYKFNPNVSVGLGYGASYMEVGQKYGTAYYAETNGEGEELERQDESYDDNFEDLVAHRIFLRGQYRLNDNKLSPFASLDLGCRFYSFSHPEDFYSSYYYKAFGTHNDYDSNEEYEPSKSGVFVTPAIGVSLRTTNNSYLEARIGYAISGSFDEKSHTKNERNYQIDAQSKKVWQESSATSGLFFSIGWAHTFGKR